MQFLLNLLIFCIVLFIYLHIYFHLKTSNDLEIYEIDNPSKEKLEEICDLRQPVKFKYENNELLDSCKKQNILEKYGAFDVKIRDVKNKVSDNEEIYVPLSFSSSLSVLERDNENKYIIENNKDFLEETGLLKSYKYNDGFIRPYMVSTCDYDYCMGREKTTTPLRHELGYRNYILVNEGSITIKLAPPKSSKYLYLVNDYEIFEFRSLINPWNVQDEYKQNYNKIKFLEITLNAGDILFIPAYWWYSIQFGKNASYSKFNYRTYMNNIAILPKILMKLLQSQNIKRKTETEVKINKIENIKDTNIVNTTNTQEIDNVTNNSIQEGQ